MIGSASTTRFSSTLALSSTGGPPTTLNWYNGNNTTATGDAVATGTAQNLHLYVNSWGSQTAVKFNIYDEDDAGTLLESVIVTSAEGTGLFSVELAGTTTITSGNLYRISLYTEDTDAITLYTDTSGFTTRYSAASGSYTAPQDPSVAGSYSSFNEWYWAVDDVTAGGSIIPQIMHNRRMQQ